MNTPITFNLAIGSRKPHSGTQKICPFCHPEKLTGIMEKKGDIIWLMNKFPVFEHTWPTVIVETSDHNGELSTYEPEKLHEVISFGLSHWLKLESDKRFKSVLYFRNYGPGSAAPSGILIPRLSGWKTMTTGITFWEKISLAPWSMKMRTAMPPFPIIP